MPFLQPIQLIEHLTDAFERAPETMSVAPSGTLAECVPLVAVALEFLGRGPAALTVEAIEAYRQGAVKLLEQVKPVLEREADLTFGEWAIGGTEPVRLRLAA